MNAPAKYQPTLADAEWNLIIQLLERERRDLPAEIRHTDTTEIREQLHNRLTLIESLLDRLHTAQGAA